MGILFRGHGLVNPANSMSWDIKNGSFLMNIVRITLDGLSTRIFSSQAVFSNNSNLSSVLSAESKIPGQKSLVIQFPLTVHYSLFKHGSTIHGYCSRFLFCLFKEARASFVSTLHFTFHFSLLSWSSPFSLLSLSSFSLLSLIM